MEIKLTQTVQIRNQHGRATFDAGHVFQNVDRVSSGYLLPSGHYVSGEEAEEIGVGRVTTLPIVNNNGDKRQDLIDQRLDVMRELDKAIDLMRQNGPHGRNYQLNPEGSFKAAQDLHRERVDMLVQLRNDLNDEALAIMNDGLKI